MRLMGVAFRWILRSSAYSPEGSLSTSHAPMVAKADITTCGLAASIGLAEMILTLSP